MNSTTRVTLAIVAATISAAAFHFWIGARRDWRVARMPVGSSRADVLRAVGEPAWKQGDDNWVYDPAWGLGWSTGIMFDKDRVSGIDWSP
jgi:hypothetical protein